MSEDNDTETTRRFLRLYYERASRTWQNTFWLGAKVYKSPLDLWIYQELIHELKPDLIVECGTAAGGSAFFFASICDLVGRGRVLTIDVTARPGRPSHPRIEYLTGSSTAESTIHAVTKAAQGAANVLVVLDSNHTCRHVLEEMRLYADVVTPGSYLVVEDGIVNGNPVLPEFGPGPAEATALFLAERHDFVVDSSREKFFMTFNPRGYLRKVQKR